jgi:LmeA-like phospholipid-binding
LIVRFALVTLLLAAVSLLVGTYVFVPPLLEQAAARSIEKELRLENTPEVELEKGSPQEVLAGRFSGGRVSMGAVDLGGARAERVVVNLDPFDLNLPATMLGRTIESEEQLSGTLRAEVSEKEVSRLARTQADVPVRDVELEEGEMVVGSEVPVLGVEVPVSVVGDMVLRDGELAFVPRGVSALGEPVPEEFMDELFAGADFSYPLAELPYGAEVTGVEVGDGRLVVSGALQHIPLEQ